MHVALVNGIDGIVAECGGSMVCGTCHVYLEPSQAALFEPPDFGEDGMLGMTAAERKSESRLSCQLMLSEAHDGLISHLPDRQV